MVPQLTLGDKSIDLDITQLTNLEIIAITKTTGLKLKPFGEALDEMDMEALTAFVWVVRKRTEPDLRYSDVTFTLGDVLANAPDDGPKDPSISEPSTTSSTDPSSGTSSA